MTDEDFPGHPWFIQGEQVRGEPRLYFLAGLTHEEDDLARRLGLDLAHHRRSTVIARGRRLAAALEEQA